MTTVIYNTEKLSATDINTKILASLKNELEWLITEIILPQLPDIKDTLEDCLHQIDEQNHDEIKLPMSSHKTEVLKGVVTRTNYKITSLNIQIKNVMSVNGGKPLTLRLKPGQSIPLRQVIDCQDFISNSIQVIERIQNIYKNSTMDKGNSLSSNLYANFEKLLTNIQNAKTSLKTPPVAYIFPLYRMNASAFEPELPPNLSLDFCVSNSDLGIDLKGLSTVTSKPWRTIVDKQQRKSFADIVRSKISQERNMSISKVIVDEYRNLLNSEKELEAREKNEKHESDSTIGSIFTSIFSQGNNPSASTLLKTANKYLEQCVTYMNNEGSPVVVTVQETCDVVTSDPILLSISVKLDSLEKTCGKLHENLEAIFSCQQTSK